MALISPILDDRTLRAAARRAGPADPGLRAGVDRPQRERPGHRAARAVRLPRRVLLFRFNQIPDTTKVEFLRLLGVQPRPAQPAHVAARRERPSGPPGVQILAGRAGARPARCTFADRGRGVRLAARRRRRRQGRPRPRRRPKADTRTARADALAVRALADDAPPTSTRPVRARRPRRRRTRSRSMSAPRSTASLWIALLRKPTTDIASCAGGRCSSAVAFDEQVACVQPCEPPPGRSGRTQIAGSPAAPCGDRCSTASTCGRRPMPWRAVDRT